MKFLIILALAAFANGQFDCGTRQFVSDTRVIGGADAVKGSFPWHVGLYKGGSFYCGASLISPNWVLTAAHCLDGIATQYTLILGDHERELTEAEEQYSNAQSIHVYPAWDEAALTGDCGLVQLSTPATYNAYVNTICLPTNSGSFYENRAVLLSGWGKTTSELGWAADGGAKILQWAQLTTITQQACKAATGGITSSIYEGNVCTQDANKGSCNGDSGGPLIFLRGDGKYEEVGIVSWGYWRCPYDGNEPAAYARVDYFNSWIASISGVTP